MTKVRMSSWGLVFLICLYCGLAGGSLGKVIPLIPDITAAMNASPLQVSLLLSVVAAVGALLAPVAGWFGDRFGDRMLLLGGLLVLGAGSALGALSGGYAGLFAGRCLEGAGYVALLTGAAAAMMRTMQGPRLAAGMALFGASVPAGIGLGEALAGIVAGSDWRIAFWGHCAALAAGIVLLSLVPPWAKASAGGHDRIDPLAIYRQPSPMRLGACLGILTMAQFATTALLPSYVHVSFGFSLTQAAFFGAIGLMASILGSLSAVAALASGASVRLLVIGSFCVFGVAGALVYAAPAGATLCIGASFVFFAAGGFANGLVLALLPRVLPDPAMRSRAGGLINQGSNLGILLAPPIVFALFGTQGPLGVAILVIVAAAAPILIMPVAAAIRQPAHRSFPVPES